MSGEGLPHRIKIRVKRPADAGRDGDPQTGDPVARAEIQENQPKTKTSGAETVVERDTTILRRSVQR